MMDCKQASKVISQSLDRKLTLRERIALKLHLFICDACKHFNHQLLTLRTSFKHLSASVENDTLIQMPSETKKRLMQSIESIKD